MTNNGSEIRKALQEIIETDRVNEIKQSFEAFVECVRAAYEKFNEFMKSFIPYCEELATVFIESPPASGCTREEWREVARLDAQRAAARANAYGRRWTAEKAREIMRRRKRKKSINARGALSGFAG